MFIEFRWCSFLSLSNEQAYSNNLRHKLLTHKNKNNPAMKPPKGIVYLIVFSVVFSGLITCKKDEGRKPNSIRITGMDPESPATLDFGEFVVITTDYYITNADGARFWVQPYTDGEISPGYLYSQSNIYDGSGIREVGISVEEGDDPEVVVDQLRVVCMTPDQDETLFEQFIDVNYTFSN